MPVFIAVSMVNAVLDILAKAYRHAIASDESGQVFDVVDYI
ncbi:hypothetical protein VCR26J2_370181 [Vibrio coralliirubri]|nr:hypothetical protein [Vibrio coralliirubri]CDT75608.1 hypothetical protein VCR26J2_370181 [Vibrio coralliirubri]